MSKNEPVYAYRWNSRRKRPGRVLSETEARSRFSSGDEFTVVLPATGGESFGPLVTFVWKNRHVVTSFLDDYGRKSMEYTYYQEDEKWLFLYMRNVWVYPNDDPDLDFPEATKSEEVLQKKDGYTKRVILDEVNHTKDTIEYSDVPVEDNWEAVPKFGNWGPIARFDR